MSGLDTTGDGQIGVVTSVSYVCYGAPGVQGDAGAAGAVGPQGPAGSEGPAGGQGDAGSASLVVASVEPPGANCPAGGTRVDTGIDANGDGVLEPGEIQRTTYLCDGIAACSLGALRCDGAQPQACTPSRQWQNLGASCSGSTPVCVDGACLCTPGATQCAINDVQTCDATGHWGTGVACTSQACVSGACTGVCTPGVKQCLGNSPEACDSTGQWATSVVCSGATPYCVNGVCADHCQAGGDGLTNCGAGSDNCCASLDVAGGTFCRTYTNSGSGPTGEADPAIVSSFRLDKYLVTVGRFRQFVNAWSGGAGWTPPTGSGKHVHLNVASGLNATGGGYEPGWVTSDNSNIAPTDANMACMGSPYTTWTPATGSNEKLPINCVNWWEAYAFCIWDGAFLPSEAEWEYAAAGGTQQRQYSWGTTAPSNNAYAIYGCLYPNGSGSCSGVTNVAPVGTPTLGVGLWGQLDLAGDMWEWNLDWYAAYAPCTDCADFTVPPAGVGPPGTPVPPYRVLRGGSFEDVASNVRPPVRGAAPPTLRSGGYGFRCAKTPSVCENGACLCSPGATQCSGNYLQTCDSTGRWTFGVCPNQACVSGACTGVCTPGATQCSGNSVQTCDSTGQWGGGVACSNQTCVSGACTGVCAPGATQCSGNNPQTCDSTGQWATGACANQACVSGACTGVCSPGATQCSGNSVQTCDASGQWGSAVAACGGTTPSCHNGLCVSTTGTSCQTSGAGLTDCGGGSESCCASLEVTGGTYYRTYTNSGSGPTGEADPATVSSFQLDKYMVTVGRFRQFVSAWNGGAGWLPPAGSGKHAHLNGASGLNATGGGYEAGWVTSNDSNIAPTDANLACGAGYAPTWTTAAGSQENLPINCANWYEAYAFCIWDGGFLPSEAEWEYADAGGSQQREYPWGAAAPGTGNQYAIYGCYYPSGSGSCAGAPVTDIAPVGTATAGAGLWGQLDLAGEMWEWNLDWYAGSYVDPCTDCANLTAATGRVTRGGNFNQPASYLLPTFRGGGGGSPTNRSYSVGLRCARTP